ncbi:hypothetical protein Bca4012_084206 [Brassica carinata]
MSDLLNQLDGFRSDERIKVNIFLYCRNSSHNEEVTVEPLSFFQVIAATNPADILDPALMHFGRLDKKIEFPHPTEEARARILQMNVHSDVNFEELARSTGDFNGAHLKAVCVEAAMLALRHDKNIHAELYI